MEHLSLFTGAGGGELGAILNGWHTIGAVEYEEYPCRVLEARQRDGCLPSFPIWQMDIREFNKRIAPIYSGMVDIISGGFPCQPFSVAGKQAGADDPRNMWPSTIECVRIIKPKYCFFENVRGLLGAGTDCDSDEWGVENTSTDSIRYFGTILRDLSESGYDARWKVISAAEVGAPHKRDRLWIVANTSEVRCDARRSEQPLQGLGQYGKNRIVANTNEIRCCDVWERPSNQNRDTNHTGAKYGSWWAVEPELGRVANGVADRVDRLKAIGNGQVSAVARAAWEILR